MENDAQYRWYTLFIVCFRVASQVHTFPVSATAFYRSMPVIEFVAEVLELPVQVRFRIDGNFCWVFVPCTPSKIFSKFISHVSPCASQFLEFCAPNQVILFSGPY